MTIDLFSIAAKTDAALVDDVTVIAKKAPKKKVILYFGPAEFFDNSKYLYLHGREHVADYQHIYCTVNIALAKNLNEQGLKALAIQSDWKKTIGIFLTAEIAVFCTNPSDAVKSRVLLAALSGAYRVQLWHGVGLKNIELMNLGNRDFSDLASLYRTRSVVEFEAILSPAPMWDAHWYKVFGATNFIRANYPRCAVLHRDPKPEELINVPSLNFAAENNVLIAPTWEAASEQHWSSNLEIIENLARKNGLKIFIKPHPFETVKEAVTERLSRSNLIDLISPTADIYPLLGKFEYLITDHSSISFDVLQTSTSIIFLEPPKTYVGPAELGGQRYDRSKLLFEFGPEVSSFRELKNFLILSTKAKEMKLLREKYLAEYFATEPTSACDHIFSAIFEKRKIS